jgi:hypothetical protein
MLAFYEYITYFIIFILTKLASNEASYLLYFFEILIDNAKINIPIHLYFDL